MIPLHIKLFILSLSYHYKLQHDNINIKYPRIKGDIYYKNKRDKNKYLLSYYYAGFDDDDEEDYDRLDYGLYGWGINKYRKELLSVYNHQMAINDEMLGEGSNNICTLMNFGARDMSVYISKYLSCVFR